MRTGAPPRRGRRAPRPRTGRGVRPDGADASLGRSARSPRRRCAGEEASCSRRTASSVQRPILPRSPRLRQASPASGQPTAARSVWKSSSSSRTAGDDASMARAVARASRLVSYGTGAGGSACGSSWRLWSSEASSPNTSGARGGPHVDRLTLPDRGPRRGGIQEVDRLVLASLLGERREGANEADDVEAARRHLVYDVLSDEPAGFRHQDGHTL